MKTYTLITLAIVVSIVAIGCESTEPSAVKTTVLAMAGEPAPTAPAIGIEALADFAQLPQLDDSMAYQDSSYSREHQNADAGNYLYTEINGKRVEKYDPKKLAKDAKVEHVMVDTDGPGVIYRMWSTGISGRVPIINPSTWIRFYFDGATTPSMEFKACELFGQKGAKWPFVSPLSRTFESGNNDMEGPASLCYVPVPFARHVKITTNALYFYHFTYLKYPKGTPVETFSMALVEKNRKTLEKAAEMMLARGEMPMPPAEGMLTAAGSLTVAPGKTAVLYKAAGPGVVRALKVKLQRATNRNLKGLVLQVRYDGSSKNSINSPIGDFFGLSSSELKYKSLPMGATDAGYYCYFPMPFRKNITISVRNDTAASATLSHTVSVQQTVVPEKAGYFHAAYHQEKVCKMGVDYNILTTSGGAGKFVGCHMFMQGGPGTEAICFLEGDEAIYVDDEKTWPSRWVGTGTEDYFNGSYYWNGVKPEDMHLPYGGITLRHDGMRRVCAYRWHITDAINFKKRIKVDMQHGPVSDFSSDYASVGYWYMSKPVAAPKLPSLAKRIQRSELPAPIMMGCRWEGRFTTNGKPLVVRHLRKVDPEYNTDIYPADLAPKRMQIFCKTKEIGQDIVGKLFVPGEDWYDINLYLTTGPSYGKFGVFLNKRFLGNINTYSESFLPARSFALGRHKLTGGAHELMFKAVNKHERATGLDFGLVAAHCKPITARHVDKWLVIGPWPCPKDGGWDKVNPPEQVQDLTAEYKFKIWRDSHGGKYVDHTAKWRAIELPPGGGVASYAYFGWESWQVCYGLTYIWSPREQTVGAFMGKDDALAVWCNDKNVLDDNTWSHYLGDHLIAALPLKKGWNKVLVKNANWFGCWAWCMKLTDPKGELKVTNVQPDEFKIKK